MQCGWRSSRTSFSPELEDGALVLIADDLSAHTAALGEPGRRSTDARRRPCGRGRRVIELESAGLTIANGSVGAMADDCTFIGNQGCSMVDYFLLCETPHGSATSLEIERHPFSGADLAALRLRLGNLLRAAATAAGGAIQTLHPSGNDPNR